MRLRRHPRSTLFACLASLPLMAAGASASDCTRDSTGLIPLTDLGVGLYQGYQGGLYSGGSNTRPPAHQAAGLAIAGSLAPLDTLGVPDPAGHIVLISIGMSNATQEFSAFVQRANADPMKNPRVRVIDCAIGGQSADRINTPTAAYWDSVATRLRGRASSPAQVQVVWIKQADAGPTGGFPAATDVFLRDLGTIVRILQDELPNLRLAFFTSRIYAGYATTPLNPEPYAYESGFAVKWLIEAQIAGTDSLNFDPDVGPVEAPWLSWGPYLWADGLEGRSDGLVWQCSDFASDGTHPAASGRARVADSLLAFFQRDPTTEPWFVNHAVDVADGVVPDGIELAVGPNPALQELTLRFRAPSGSAWRLEAYDLAGRRAAIIARGDGGGTRTARWRPAKTEGALPSGVYWIRLASGGQAVARRVVVIGR